MVFSEALLWLLIVGLGDGVVVIAVAVVVVPVPTVVGGREEEWEEEAPVLEVEVAGCVARLVSGNEIAPPV